MFFLFPCLVFWDSFIQPMKGCTSHPHFAIRCFAARSSGPVSTEGRPGQRRCMVSSLGGLWHSPMIVVIDVKVYSRG